MNHIPDFIIDDGGNVSRAFRDKSIQTFHEACDYIKHLPYGRNADKLNLLTVFTDSCGTCSTKHALLKQLVEENGQKGYRLVMGLYKMNGINTRPVDKILRQYGLEYIPEAHCYLKLGEQIIDLTAVQPLDFVNDLLEETEIASEQITDHKVNYHRRYLGNWLAQNDIKYNLDELWAIREACISALAGNQ